MSHPVIELSVEAYNKLRSSRQGICINCGARKDLVGATEGDRMCPDCGKREVVGVENGLVWGHIKLAPSARAHVGSNL
jgi:predicted RNA-binding Zn-ribbon protein involved in translation (DUF1610 family)